MPAADVARNIHLSQLPRNDLCRCARHAVRDRCQLEGFLQVCESASLHANAIARQVHDAPIFHHVAGSACAGDELRERFSGKGFAEARDDVGVVNHRWVACKTAFAKPRRLRICRRASSGAPYSAGSGVATCSGSGSSYRSSKGLSSSIQLPDHLQCTYMQKSPSGRRTIAALPRPSGVT